MTALSNYLENAVGNAVLRATSYSSPATVYLALYSTNPAEGNTGTELSGNGYERETITFSAPSDGVFTSSNVITFGPASSSWSAATHVGILDASTSGNLLVYGALSASLTATTNKVIVFNIGDITVTLA